MAPGGGGGRAGGPWHGPWRDGTGRRAPGRPEGPGRDEEEREGSGWTEATRGGSFFRGGRGPSPLSAERMRPVRRRERETQVRGGPMRDGGVPREMAGSHARGSAPSAAPWLRKEGRRRRGQICSLGQGVAVLVGHLPLSPEAGPRAAPGPQLWRGKQVVFRGTPEASSPSIKGAVLGRQEPLPCVPLPPRPVDGPRSGQPVRSCPS